MSLFLILLAAGDSKRLKSNTPKPYNKVNNKTLLEHSLDAFQNFSKIKKTVIVYNKKHKKYLNKLNLKYTLKIVGGKTRQESTFKALKKIKKMNLRYSKFFTQISKAVKDTNCVMTDVWVSMGEKNSKSKKMILQDFQVNEQVMKYAKKNAIFMHCLPAHRNEEVTDSVIDGKKSVVWQQAQNRTYVQQSILNFLLKS